MFLSRYENNSDGPPLSYLQLFTPWARHGCLFTNTTSQSSKWSPGSPWYFLSGVISNYSNLTAETGGTHRLAHYWFSLFLNDKISFILISFVLFRQSTPNTVDGPHPWRVKTFSYFSLVDKRPESYHQSWLARGPVPGGQENKFLEISLILSIAASLWTALQSSQWLSYSESSSLTLLPLNCWSELNKLRTMARWNIGNIERYMWPPCRMV